jgi:hypothetical protein
MTNHHPMTLAEEWASRGVPAFPVALHMNGTGRIHKAPMTPRGHLDASTDPDLVRDMFVQAGEPREGVLGVGLAPGPGGYVVLDPDVKDGSDGVAFADGLGVPAGWCVTTPSGGQHRWFAKPDPEVRFGNAVPPEWRGLIDVRADNGWVVAPGVVTPWGTWAPAAPWEPTGVPVLPGWVVGALGTSAGPSGTSGHAGGLLSAEARAGLLDHTREVLEWLEREHGAHSARLVVRAGEPDYVAVTRPGKDDGISATVGFGGPGAVFMWSSSWEVPECPQGHSVYPLGRDNDLLGAAESADSAESAESLPTPLPAWRLPHTVADEVRAWFVRFLKLMEDRDYDLLTLWAAHTHVIDHLGTTPRLIITSPVPEAGKTTILEHLERVAHAGLQFGSVTTPAMLSRVLAVGMRTLLIDEVDRNLRPDRAGVEDLIVVLNSGYKKGATRPTLVPQRGGDWVAVELPTFAPVAMAGRSPHLPADTLTRSVVIHTLPDIHGDAEDSDWEEIEDEAAGLNGLLRSWGAHVGGLPPADLGPGVRGRAKERWRPLARVAAALGGEWPERCAALIEHDRAIRALDREDGLEVLPVPVRLLSHVIECWPGEAEHWATESVVASLRATHPEDWGPTLNYPKGLTSQRLGRVLAATMGIRAQQAPSGRRLGIARADVLHAGHALGVVPSDSADSAESADSAAQNAALEALQGLITVDPTTHND